MQENFDIVLDFEADLRQCLIKSFSEIGHKHCPDESTPDLAVTFFNVMKRRIYPTPRKVVTTKEFRCPPPLQDAYSSLLNKVVAGEDLSAHLSKKAKKRDYNDMLLNDWDIHHFHFHLALSKARTKDLLFARVTPEKFYVLCVMPHRNWSDKALIEILHRNWPDTIRQFRIDGIAGVEPVFSNEETGRLRKAGISLFHQLDDGTVYRPLGGGYMSSKVSADAERQARECYSVIRSSEKCVRENISTLAEQAVSQGHAFEQKVHFRFRNFDGKHVIVSEENTGLHFAIQFGQNSSTT